MVQKSRHAVSVALAALLLSACGGGSSSDSTPSSSVLTGSFIDSPVKGLSYKTPTQSGLTNELGEFLYLDGESVTFSLGGTQLGITKGADIVTPFSLFGIKPIKTEFEISQALSGDKINSFDRAINVATLLQTFDMDADPENGIDLGSAHTKLLEANIPLNVKARNFVKQVELSNAKLIMDITKIRTFGAAVQHVYNSLNIDIESKLAAKFTSRQNNKQLETIEFDYNADGLLTSEIIDRNNDGIADNTKTFAYDNKGNLIQAANSATSTNETLSYDNRNNLVSRMINNEQGENIQESYQYTDNKLERFELDQNADGSIELSTRYTYDDLGNITATNTDKNGDGTTDSLATYTYTDNALSAYVEDNDNDGTPNIIIGYSYDVNGNRISQNVDLSSGGAPQSLSSFQYDSHNNPIRYEQDNNLDGLADYIEAYAYNKNNQRTHYKRDLNADGIWDVIAQYFYDVNGKRVKMIEDSDGNGIVDKVWTGEYQAAILDNTWDKIIDEL